MNPPHLDLEVLGVTSLERRIVDCGVDGLVFASFGFPSIMLYPACPGSGIYRLDTAADL